MQEIQLQNMMDKNKTNDTVVQIVYHGYPQISSNKYSHWMNNNFLSDLYTNLHSYRIDLADVKITNYYMNIPMTTFSLCYKNGLIMYDTENYIKLATIFPQYQPIDLLLAKVFVNGATTCIPIRNISAQPHCGTQESVPQNDTFSHVQENISICENINIPNQSVDNIFRMPNIISHTDEDLQEKKVKFASIDRKQRHINFLERAKIAKIAKNNKIVKKNNNKIVTKNNKKEFDEEFELKKEKEREKKIEENRKNEKLKIFESDKRSYIQIKKDIQNGLLLSSSINPYFMLKYEIFKVLEKRNCLDVNSNDNIYEEYDIFRSLYEECDETDADSCEEQPVKVYIPHNYQYMSTDKKEEYANKYKMTRHQFEDKYINGIVDDDIIEKCIKNGSTLSETNKKENEIVNKELCQEKLSIGLGSETCMTISSDKDSEESDTDTDSDDDEKLNKSSVDEQFKVLTKDIYHNYA